MVGVIEYETKESIKRSQRIYSEGGDVPDEDRDFFETDIHFDKRMLGEFYRSETHIVAYINGRRYLLLWDEELYKEMVNVHR